MPIYGRILHLFLQVFSPLLINGAPTATSVSSLTDDAPYHCYDSPDWCGPSFTPKNCATAVSQFMVQELLVHEDILFEFLAAGGRKTSRYLSQKTPQKFTYSELSHI